MRRIVSPAPVLVIVKPASPGGKIVSNKLLFSCTNSEFKALKDSESRFVRVADLYF